jgi:hypothetical protein
MVTREMNNVPIAEFTEEEIGDALFQIGPLKAPGSDGLHARFFQRNWELLKFEICKAIKQFFDDGLILENFNMTKIVLIPKSTDAIELKDFRPISLCNVVYKIIAQCIINRLRPFLQDLISETQSAFVLGRLISDNALIAFECFHAIHRAKKGEDSFSAYKMDLTKAYDRVDWSFLEGMLIQYGFDPLWVTWVMSCIKSVKFKVRISDQLTEEIVPTRGLRQGGPLSPYLFLFVAECFSKVLKSTIHNQGLREFRICRSSPGISHLMFVDDCVLFFEANGNQVLLIKQAITNFEKCSR